MNEGPPARARLLDRLPGRLVNLGDVVPVDRARRKPERGGAGGDALAGRDCVGGGELGVAVVLADEDDRRLPERGQVQRLEEDALVRSAVAEKRHRDCVPAELLAANASPTACGIPPPTNPVGADRPLGRRAHVHGAALAAAIAACSPEDLGEHALRVEAAREHVVVAAMGRGDLVAFRSAEQTPTAVASCPIDRWTTPTSRPRRYKSASDSSNRRIRIIIRSHSEPLLFVALPDVNLTQRPCGRRAL
jgi:hypothetical protein